MSDAAYLEERRRELVAMAHAVDWQLEELESEIGELQRERHEYTVEYANIMAQIESSNASSETTS